MPTPEGTSVLVATYDEGRWDDLVACLRSLERQTRPPLETIVVVDGNAPLLERVADAFPGVEAVANARSRGLAGARNTGVDLARGALIAFIDDDARAEPGWLERLGDCFAEPETVGAGGALIPRWEDGKPGWLPPEFYWTIGCSYAGLPTSLAPVRNPIGANMAVRASVLREVGGFREGTAEEAPREIRSRGVVRAGGNVPDDTDLAIRVSQLLPDAVWLYQPSAVVRHTVTRERTTLAYFAHRCFEEGSGKAGLARYVGSRQGLSAERRHLARVLPAGFLEGVGQLLHGDLRGPLRSAVIVLGLAAVAAGFLAGEWAIRRR